MVRFFALLTLMLLPLGAAFAQSVERDQIRDAFRNGNARGLSAHFTTNIDLTVEQVGEVYSKEQAEMVLSRFFSDHSPQGFEIRHEGKSKGDDHYCIGNLTTSKTPYRVTFFLKKEGEVYKMRQLRIEPD